jgi:hypothetical protein
MVAELVTVKISGATYDAANVDMLWSWVSEGRVPDDSQIRLRGGDPFERAPDVLSRLIDAELARGPRLGEDRSNAEAPEPSEFSKVVRNAYRVLGVASESKLAQLRAIEARTRRHQELGRAAVPITDLRVLPSVELDPRTVVDAIATLEDPLRRLRERVWWFLRASDLAHAKGGQTREFVDPHSRLLYRLLELAANDLAINRGDDWRATLEQWRELLTSSNFSETLIALDAETDFERRLKHIEAGMVQGVLQDEWSSLFLWVVDQHVVNRNHSALAKGLAVARDIRMPIPHDLRDTVGAELDRLLGPSFQRAYQFLARVNRTEHATPTLNRLAVAAAERTLIEDIQPTIDLFAAALPADDLTLAEAQDATTELLYSIGVASTWTDDYARAEMHLSSAAERTPRDSPLAGQIAETSEHVQASRRRGAIFEGATPGGSPTLFTFNGIGATFYGRSNHDPATNSYITTHYFVFVFIPLFALARYRVIEPESGRYQILAKYPLTKANKWHSAVAAAVALALVLYASMTPSTASTGSAASTSSASLVDSGARAPLSNLKQEIETARAQMERLDKLVASETTQLEAINRELEGLKPRIESMEADHAAGRRVDSDEYDRLLAAYNRNVERYNALLATQKVHIDEYNTLLAADGKLVDEYNEQLRRAR